MSETEKMPFYDLERQARLRNQLEWNAFSALTHFDFTDDDDDDDDDQEQDREDEDKDDSNRVARGVHHTLTVLRQARKEIGWARTVRWSLFTLCVALQSIELPALLLLEIFDRTHSDAVSVEMNLKWQVIVAVKHYFDRRKAQK